MAEPASAGRPEGSARKCSLCRESAEKTDKDVPNQVQAKTEVKTEGRLREGLKRPSKTCSPMSSMRAK